MSVLSLLKITTATIFGPFVFLSKHGSGDILNGARSICDACVRLQETYGVEHPVPARFGLDDYTERLNRLSQHINYLQETRESSWTGNLPGAFKAFTEALVLLREGCQAFPDSEKETSSAIDTYRD